MRPLPPTALSRRGPYDGLGSWVDMFSWSATFTPGGNPHFGLADIDAMAAKGVQNLYIQGASQTGPATVLEADRLLALIARAHRDRIAVVVWYLPSLVNPADDLARLLAISRLPAEGVAVDIESIDVANVAARNAALVGLSRQLRQALPDRPLGAIVMPATQLEVVNPYYWPSFPYLDLAPFYDAWLPMTYWTGRLPESGFRDGYRYTADSIHRLRLDLGAAPRPQGQGQPDRRRQRGRHRPGRHGRLRARGQGDGEHGRQHLRVAGHRPRRLDRTPSLAGLTGPDRA